MRADIARAIGGLIWACVLIAGLLAGEWIAQVYLSEGLVLLIVVGVLVGLVLLIASHVRHKFLRGEARRRAMAEACGLRAEDLV